MIDRALAGRATEPTAAVLDSQTVKAPVPGAERGFDGGKIVGRKRHVGVDTDKAALKRQQQDLIGTMDDVRSAGRGFLDPLVQAGLHGTSILAGLRSGLESVASKITGKLEDTAIDSLFGKSGTTGARTPLGGPLSSLFGGGGATPSGFGSYGPQLPGAGDASGLLAGVGKLFGFSGGGYTGPGSKYQPAGIVHAGEYVVQAEHVPQNINILHALNTTERVPGYADCGLVGGGPMSSGGDMPSGDTHLHTHVHIDGASGDAHVHRLATQAASAVLQHPKSVAFMSGAVAERQRSGTR